MHVNPYRLYRLLAISLAFALLMACDKEPSSLELPMEEAIVPYFEAFEQEGSKRGLSIDLAAQDIGAAFSSTLEGQTAGKCTSFSSGTQIIYINPQSWEQRSELEREFLVFHELGHCYLGRGHLDEADEKGFCLSIMQSGAGRCRDSYRPATREALLDELFDNK